jgi:hypothetical protein
MYTCGSNRRHAVRAAELAASKVQSDALDELVELHALIGDGLYGGLPLQLPLAMRHWPIWRARARSPEHVVPHQKGLGRCTDTPLVKDASKAEECLSGWLATPRIGAQFGVLAHLMP